MLRKSEYVAPEVRKLREQFSIDTPKPGLLEWLTPPTEALGRWLDLLLMEKRKWTRLSWKHRLRAWRNGFSSFSYRLYELERNPPGDYISDKVAILFGYRPNGRYNEAIFSKITLSRILKSLDVPQPPVLGIICRGLFYPEEGGACDLLAGIRKLLKQSGKLVLRPSFGGGGTGILFVDGADNRYRVNSLAADSQTLERLLYELDDYLVTGFVEQAAYAREIFPATTNTLRILTLWDFERDESFIAAACHRFGRTGFGPLDNFHAGAGGTSVSIDIASGKLGRAVIREEGEIKRLDQHPDTGKPIEGQIVPDWARTKDQLLDLAMRFPHTPCVGWDIVKLEDGWTCLEGNPMPGYHVWQVHGPILKDPRVRRFYREFGILK